MDARGTSIRALAVSDTLLLVASEIGVEVFDRRSGAWRTIAAGEEREVQALALAVDPSGAAWIGTTAGLSRWRPDTGEWEDWTVADGLAGTPVLYVLAEDGVDPDKEVQIRVVPPPEMVANLRAGNLDGYLAPDPFNQRAVYEEIAVYRHAMNDHETYREPTGWCVDAEGEPCDAS